MFQASIQEENINSTSQLSFDWFIRDVTVMPFVISKERTLVQRDSLVWSVPSGKLSVGPKLIELEVKLANFTSVRRDFGFIKVEEPRLVALINGGSETLISSKKRIALSASDSFDPGIGINQHFGMTFSWFCFDGGQLLPDVYSGNKTVLVPSEPAKTNASKCKRKMPFSQNKMAAFRRFMDADHIYYIKLVVKKDQRQSEYLRTLHAADQDILPVAIRYLKFIPF